MLCQQAPAQLRINEILALNASVLHDPDFGGFSDFIELYNDSPSPVHLENYTISDKPWNPTKWTFPDIVVNPGQYLLLWADGRDVSIGDTAYCEYKDAVVIVKELHTNFSLSGDGEYVGLFNSDGELLDELYFSVQSNDISYGRDPTNPEKWLYFSDVTPGKRNSDYGAADLVYAPAPTFSLREGFYTQAQSLRIIPPSPSTVIRFSFDGSTPDADSPVFPDTFSVIRSYVIKARAFEAGKLPSPVAVATYFIGQNTELPVISISTDAAHLYDIDYGILRNAIRGRDIPAEIEYFDVDGKRGFVCRAGVRVFGTTIYNLPQRPLSIRFRARYGQSELNYRLFEDKDIERFSSFLLRNGGNDYNLAYFRDGLAVNLAKHAMDIDYQAYKPCIVFINGEYHGIYEIRERLDHNYIAGNHNVSNANLDLLEDSLLVIRGDERDYLGIIDFISTNDLSEQNAYEYIASKIDVHEYINYMIHKIFIGYRLFQLNNKYWRDRESRSPWRWIANDMEHAFGQLSGDDHWENTLQAVSGDSGDLPDWSTLLFEKLLTNTMFRDEFVQRFALYLNTIYRPEVTVSVLDSLKAHIASEMPRHILRWNTPSDISVWEANIDFIESFLRNRPDNMRAHISQQFGVMDSALVNLEILGKGTIIVSGVPVSDSLFSGHFFRNTGISLSAEAQPGYRFKEWHGIATDSSHTVLNVLGDTSIIAVFERSRGNIIPAVVSSDTTLRASLSPWYGVEDIVIHPGATLAVEEAAEILMTDKASIYVHGGLRISGTESNNVVITTNPAVTARRPDFNSRPRWGVIVAIDATDSLVIRHANLSGSGYGRNRQLHFAAVTSLNSHVRISHTYITDNIQPFYSEGGSVYIGYSAFRCDNTCDLINVKYSDSAVVEYCDLFGNNAPDTDGIDYDGVVGGVIRNNRIYGFVADNSDGIDLGEHSRDILIENNIIHDCGDKGISIGQASTALIRRNVIFACDMGVAVKDSFSFAMIDQNTLYSNNYSIACYEKNTSRGGGAAEVKNTILANSLKSTLLLDAVSSITVTYSLSDTEKLNGTGNIFDDPMFVQASTGNFELHPDSPCIDAGDPDSPLDPDSTRADIGAYYRHSGASTLAVHINEINYHPPANYDTGDWVELYNATTSTVNLENWSIMHGSSRFVIGSPVLLQPGEYVVVCEDTTRFRQFHPDVVNIVGDMNFGFSNSTGRVSVFDAEHRLVYALRYEDDWPWPPLADGLGATLELDHDKEGNAISDWRESYVLMGTPGAENSRPLDRSGLFINEFMASNGNVIADEYGEYDDWFEIYNDNDYPVDIGGLYFTDDLSYPQKWQLPLNAPESTTISPRGFLLLWADGQPWQGPLHVDFRLSVSGEQLGMFQRISDAYDMIDGIVFGEQERNVAYGRYPDGGQTWSFMSPTPGYSNVLTGVRRPVPSSFVVYPNPFDTHVTLDTRDIAKPFTFRMYSVLGAVIETRADTYSNSITLNRGTLPGGVYIYVLFDAKGNHYTGKIVAK